MIFIKKLFIIASTRSEKNYAWIFRGKITKQKKKEIIIETDYTKGEKIFIFPHEPDPLLRQTKRTKGNEQFQINHVPRTNLP